MVQVVKLSVIARHVDLAALQRRHRDVHLGDGQHFGVLAVDEVAHGAAAGAAYPVACALRTC